MFIKLLSIESFLKSENREVKEELTYFENKR